MLAMTAARAPALALTMVARSALAAQAQTPWPSAEAGTLPWPSQAATKPISDEALECMRKFNHYRAVAVERGLAAKAASQKEETPSREQFCKLVTAYSDAEMHWIKFTADNLTKCGIRKEILEQIKTALAHTQEARTNLCSAGWPGDWPKQSPGDWPPRSPTPFKFFQKIAGR